MRLLKGKGKEKEKGGGWKRNRFITNSHKGKP